MEKLCDKKICTACMACYNACSFDAIEMKEDELGALVPEINEEKCKNCGKCTKACPILNPPQRNSACEAIALYTKNEDDRKTCASGGVSTTFARNVIEQGGAVFGVGFSPDGTPIYKKAETMAELEEFKGSKYVYCFPGLVYKDTEKELKAGRKCIFVGTPCHVAGLLNYLGKEYDNLVTVDLICHGTPPFSYLKEHIKSLKIDHYSKFTFRGEHDYKFVVYGERNNILYKKDITEDSYFTAFSNCSSVREVCLFCKYASQSRVSDITIGDFWGIKRPALNNYTGKISLILANTKKGHDFFNICRESFVFEVRDIAEAVNGNPKLRKPTGNKNEQKQFADEYKKTRDFERTLANVGIRRQVRLNRIKNSVLRIPRKIILEVKKK